MNANNGHTTMESTVCHYTVGRDSRPVGDRGYFHFLVSRDGTVTQFARADAVCWHAGDPWNGRGPGIEVEYLPGADDDVFTPASEAATAQLVAWLEDEWGIPADFYDGPRRQVWHGFITHRSLIQTGDAHSDYWPYLPTTPLPPVPGSPGEVTTMFFLKSPSGVRLMMGPIFTGVSESQYQQLRGQGVPELDVVNMGQDGENLANQLAAWSARQLNP